MDILEVRGLTKRYGSFTAVADVSFSIGAGGILGYLGPNGSGKSTTVKMITGLLEPTAGEILHRGRRVRDDVVAFKRSIGYVPEEAQLYGFLTGWEYLEMVATLRAIPRATFERKAKALLEAFTLFTHRDAAIASYSKGMRQRIALISATLHDPELLILDEPFTGLDVTSSIVLRQVIERLAAAGKAVFFASPAIEVIERLANRIVLLRKGQQVAAGALSETLRQLGYTRLEDAFIGMAEETDTAKTAAQIVDAIRSA
ncbi:MAG: ABC transporter ATP-binding protein [Acidobacteria bacterium]|nr:ABC transporter ATP-binding protein [Acidobacteriota bacterium]